MTSWFGADFDRVARWAKREFGPFRLRTYHGLRIEGDACFGAAAHDDEEGWTILLDRNQTHEVAVQTLLHEIGHVLDDSPGAASDDWGKQHGAGWSRAYGRIYRSYFEALERGEL